MKATTSVKIAGAFTFLFFLFHIPFYWMLNWEQTLACLSRDNWAIVMCFNIISIVLLFLMSFVSLFQTKEMVSSKLGKSVLTFSSWFYAFRIVAEFVFFDEPNKVVSAVIIIMCAIPALLFALPLFFKRTTETK